MKGLILLCLMAVSVIADVTGDQSIDPRGSPSIDKALKEDARYHCYYRCHQNPDDCSKDARRDLATCENLLYWVYFTNYETCMGRCLRVKETNQEAKPYIDCEYACLSLAEEKVRKTSKTPDQLIHAYFDNRQHGLRNVYIE